MFINEALDLVQREYASALLKYPKAEVSDHGAYAMLLGEVDELWDAIKANQDRATRNKAVQVAAMALRFLVERCNVKPGETL